MSEYFTRSEVRASFWLFVRCFEAEFTKCCKWLFLPEEANEQLCLVVQSLCVESAPTCLSFTSSIMPTFNVLYSVIGLSVGLHNRMRMFVPLDSSRDLATRTCDFCGHPSSTHSLLWQSGNGTDNSPTVSSSDLGGILTVCTNLTG